MLQEQGIDREPTTREQVEKRIHALVGEIKSNPKLEAILHQRQQELGLGENSRLMKVVRTRSLKRALTLSVDDLTRHRGLSR